MSRELEIIERIKNNLILDGYDRRVIRLHSKYGIGSPSSYFDALIDRKLEGKEYPTAQEVWEEMKEQINYLQGALLTASVEYSKLETKIRGLESDNKDLIKEIK